MTGGCFPIGGPGGSWTALPTYDSSAFQTTFTNAAANWGEDAWAGKLLKPDVAGVLQSLIVANTTNTITVWGDFTPDEPILTSYTINDYHLTALSPCVETGDPEFTGEPDETDIDDDRRVLGCRVDMGADEYLSGGIASGDLNGDASVDTDDLRLFVETLVSGAPLGNCPGDMNQDGNHDGLDIQPFIESLLVR